MANKKYYLDQDGVRTLVSSLKGEISTKMDSVAVSTNFLSKADAANTYVPKTELNSYATKAFVGAQIAGIPEYDDTEVVNRITSLEGKATGLYHYKGSVADAAALNEIQNPEVGDTYNLEDSGMNAAWNGEAWDEFGSVVDLTPYVKAEDVVAIARAELNNILFSGKKASVSDRSGFEAMVANDEPVVEITLNSDLELDEHIEIPTGKTVVLNLNDSEVVCNKPNDYAFTVEGGSLTISGGTITNPSGRVASVQEGTLTVEEGTVITSGNCAIDCSGANSEVVIEGGSITAQEVPVLVLSGASATINGGELSGLDNFAIGGNGLPGKGDINVTINGGTIRGHIQSAGYIAAGIYWPNSGTLTINGGTIISDGCGICMRGGTVNLNSGTSIIANGTTGVKGKVGDSRVVVGPYAIVYDANSKYPDWANMELNIAADVVLQGTDGDMDVLLADNAVANINDLRP